MRDSSSLQNEDDLAAQLVGFMQQFLEVFHELKGKNFYVSGESVSHEYPFHRVETLTSLTQYAGMYVPCK